MKQGVLHESYAKIRPKHQTHFIVLKIHSVPKIYFKKHQMKLALQACAAEEMLIMSGNSDDLSSLKVCLRTVIIERRLDNRLSVRGE